MIRLDKNKALNALEVYRRYELFFPLIAAVLQSIQHGVVYADDGENPTQFYVEHSFGFSQLFGEQNLSFEHELERYLLVEGRFHASKIRLYGTYVPDFLKVDHEKLSLSIRQRFRLGETYVGSQVVLQDLPHRGDIDLAVADQDNIDSIEEKFGVVGRFWRSSDEFIAHSNAVVVQYKGAIAAICYSAATADRRAEIDVMTLPEFRKLGLAKLTVSEFIENCKKQAIEPLWDCFTNNKPSMILAESIGYLSLGKSYSFYTINR